MSGMKTPSQGRQKIWRGNIVMFLELTRDDVFTLETPRLWLRWPRVADSASIQRLAGEKDVALMTANLPYPYPDGAAEGFVFAARKGNALGSMLAMALVAKAKPQELIGMIGLRAIPDSERLELGYWLGKPHWNKGLMSEAARAMVDVAFRLSETASIEAGALPENGGSQRVLAKAGFTAIGTGLRPAPARGGFISTNLYRLEHSQWRAAQSMLRLDQARSVALEPAAA
jgi:RimJ/RimL family protein N-acetyltransferase